MFSPGSACKQFDQTALDQPPTCTINATLDSTDPACDAWARRVSPSLSFGAFCGGALDDAGLPRCQGAEVGIQRESMSGDSNFADGHIIDDRVRCSPGADGDQYCQAFFAQFVNGSAKIAAHCEKICDWLPMTTTATCYRHDQACWNNQFGGDCSSYLAYACISDESEQACGAQSGAPAPTPRVCVDRGKGWTLERLCAPFP